MAEVAAEFAAEPDVLAVAVGHRVGAAGGRRRRAGRRGGTAHRHEAFDICARLVDEVKRRLPIWKRQVFTDGTDEWVNYP